jgi:hypothetical protein
VGGRKIYTPVYSAVAASSFVSVRSLADVISDSFASGPLVDLATWGNFIESNVWARWATPGALIHCDAISPNDILRGFGMCMGYYGELVISGMLRRRFEHSGLRYSTGITCADGEYFLLEPYLLSDCLSESEKADDNLVGHILKWSREYAERRLVQCDFPCVVMPGSLRMLFREDVANAIAGTPGFDKYFSFYIVDFNTP